MSVWKMLSNKNIIGKVTGAVVAGSMLIGTALPAFARQEVDIGIDDNLGSTTSPSPSPSETVTTTPETQVSPSPTSTPSTSTPSTSTPNTETSTPSTENTTTDTSADTNNNPETSAQESTEQQANSEQQNTGQSTQPETTTPVVEVEDGTDVEASEETEEEIIVAYPNGIINMGSDTTIALIPERVEDIIATLPAGISADRVSVVLNAYSLIGKVSYFWGGKSYSMGWNSSWGNSAYVFSAGSSSTGTYRPYGLDCSGYVAWAFCNAAGYSVADSVGISTTSQWAASTPSSKENAMPGDLALFYDPNQSGSINHVGIIVGWDVDGEPLVAHCSSSKGTVTVTRFTQTGFNFVRTPNVYSDETFQTDSFNYKNLGTYLLWNATDSVEYDSAEAGDLIYSAESSWGGEAVQVGKIVGRDIVGNLMVSYTYAEDDKETIKGDEDAKEAAEFQNAEATDAEVTDAETTDAEVTDAEVTDAQVTDAEPTDAASETDAQEANPEETAETEETDTKLTIIKPTDEGVIIRSIKSAEAASSYFDGILPITKIKHIFGNKEVLSQEEDVQEEDAEEAVEQEATAE